MGAVVAIGIVIIGLLNGSRLITMRGGLQYDWVTLAIVYLAASFLGGPIGANQSIRFTIDAGSAIIYGSTTDNTTNDPAIQFVIVSYAKD